MKKFYTTLFLALVYTMATFAQGLPNGGQTLPYYGKQMKASKYSVMKAPMLAGEVLITPPETAVIEENWSIEGNYIKVTRMRTQTLSKWHSMEMMFTFKEWFSFAPMHG